MKFVFITQTDNIASYMGTSGLNYTIYKGEPFQVDNELDIEFFKNNKRFKKAGLFDKKEIQKSSEDLMNEKLNELEFLSKTTKEKLIKLYVSFEELKDTILQNYELDQSIPKKQADELIKYIKGD